jgi:hypothetical protein
VDVSGVTPVPVGGEEPVSGDPVEPVSGEAVAPPELLGGGSFRSATAPTVRSVGVSEAAAGASISGAPAGSDAEESPSPALAFPKAKAAPAATSRPTTASAMTRELAGTALSHLSVEHLDRSLALPGMRQRGFASQSFFWIV